MSSSRSSDSSSASARLRVWDLPTRVFHWAIAISVTGAFVSAKIGGNAMIWHFRFGYCVLTLVAFRLVWGLIGGRYARFASFLFGPASILAYLRGRPDAPRTAGHNPMGALSVFALLSALGFQAVSGLFSNDDIASDGPMVKFISKELSDRITGWHHTNEWVIAALVSTHVAAILFYLFARKENLITPMLSGDKKADSFHANAPASRDDAALRFRALVVLAVFAAIVYAIVNWPARTF
jgi:cytochrome b